MLRQLAAVTVSLMFAGSLPAQVSAGAGTIEGVVSDATGAVIPGATVAITNPVSGYRIAAKTDANGAFIFRNVPPNPYHTETSAPGFNSSSRDVEVRGSVPVSLKVTLQVAGSKTELEVEATGSDLVETVSSAHTDMDRELYSKLPLSSGGGMADLITLASPGVAADSNGFFHPLGDHAQSSLYVDGSIESGVIVRAPPRFLESAGRPFIA